MAAHKKGKHAAIHAMGKEYVDKLDALLVKGTSSLKAANIVKDEWGLCSGDKVSTLQKRIQRYKKDVLDHHLHTEILTEDGKKLEVKMTLKKDDPKVDVLDAVTELVRLQQYRVQKMYDLEHNMPTLLGSLRKEVKQLSDLLKQLSDLQFDLGLAQRTPRTIKGDISMAFGTISEQEEKFKRLSQIQSQKVEAGHEVFAILDEILEEEGNVIEHTAVSES